MDSQARRWWALPEPRPVVPSRPAATVLLVAPAVEGDSADRDGNAPSPRSATAGLQVFMQQRLDAMAFAPGALVFPGGGREPHDIDITHTALRELYEECGLLLATDDRGLFPDTTAPQWQARFAAPGEAAQSGGTQARLSIEELAAAAGLTLRTDLLRPWARWVTPRHIPRRFDTWFFVVVLPDVQLPGGAAPRHLDAEAVRSVWVDPADVLADADAPLLPPTRMTLEELARIATVAELEAALAKPRSLVPQLTELVEIDGRLFMQGPEPDLPTVEAVRPGSPASPATDDPAVPTSCSGRTAGREAR